MKLSFSKEDLIRAIQAVQSSISTKSTLPILSNLLIRSEKTAKGLGIRIEATDLEVGIRCGVKGEALEVGKITVPAKRFGDLVREMPNDHPIELNTSDGRRVELQCGKVKATILSLPPEDFPLIPEFPEEKSFKLKKSLFQDMIRKTHFAISFDETRYVLNGIYFLAQQGEIKMVATDGRRLAYVWKNGFEKNLNATVIIPSKAVSELMRLLSAGDFKEDWIQIAPYENQISFKWMDFGEEIHLLSRVIDGKFPNYEQVIPKTKEIEISVETTRLLSAVKRAALFAQDHSGSVRFALSDGFLKISANAQNVGEEEEELEVPYKGAHFEIAFNPHFLLDVLKNSEGPKVNLEFTNSLNPGMIKPAGVENYLCVIMPMRLQN